MTKSQHDTPIIHSIMRTTFLSMPHYNFVIDDLSFPTQIIPKFEHFRHSFLKLFQHISSLNALFILFCMILSTNTMITTNAQSLGKGVSLSPSNTNDLGARVISHWQEVSSVSFPSIGINEDIWQVDIASENSWQFILFLDPTWGFSSVEQTGIEIKINSPSIFAGSNTFDILVFGFTVDNTNYFSTWISMDNNGVQNSIYPECDPALTPTQTLASGDVSALPNTDRTCDIAGGSCINWRTMWPKNSQFPDVSEYNGFPITYTLQNDPIDDYLTVTFETATFSSGFYQQCGFVSMPTDLGLKVYIGGGDIGESFFISSIDVTYLGPSVSPTRAPTNNPTAPTFPTIAPTSIPSKYPSTNPSKSPTEVPSVSPSKNPSIMPTKNPTYNPSIVPTGNPSVSPTNDPTFKPSTKPSTSPSNNPSIMPTKNPSVLPTKPPSHAPSFSPSDSPSYSPSLSPSMSPTLSPIVAPSMSPSVAPSIAPTNAPSFSPSGYPTSAPSTAPTTTPSTPPTAAPSLAPSLAPSNAPSSAPTAFPSFAPTLAPSNAPTQAPTFSPIPLPKVNVETSLASSTALLGAYIVATCALCCIALLIARYLYTKRRRKGTRKGSSPMHKLEDKDMQKNMSENIELESVAAANEIERSMNASVTITRYDAHSSNRRSTSDMADGQILTIPQHPAYAARVNNSNTGISRRAAHHKNKIMMNEVINEHEIYKPHNKTSQGEIGYGKGYAAGKPIDLLSTAYTESNFEPTPDPAYNLLPSSVDARNPTPAPTAITSIAPDSKPATKQPAPITPIEVLEDCDSSSSTTITLSKHESKIDPGDNSSETSDDTNATRPQYHDYSSKNLMTLAQIESINSLLSQSDKHDHVRKAFDPTKLITTAPIASPLSTSPEYQSVYKIKPSLGYNNISMSICNLDSVKTNDSVGTKMPHYRGGGINKKIKSKNSGKSPFKSYANQQKHDAIPQANRLEEEDTFEKSQSHSVGTVRYVG